MMDFMQPLTDKDTGFHWLANDFGESTLPNENDVINLDEVTLLDCIQSDNDVSNSGCIEIDDIEEIAR